MLCGSLALPVRKLMVAALMLALSGLAYFSVSSPSAAATCSGVPVPSRTSLQTAINDNRASGTTFCLAAGTFDITAPMAASSGDSFIGVSGQTVLDGGGTTQYSFDPNASNISVSDLVIQHFSVDGIDLNNDSTVNGLGVRDNATGIWFHGQGDVVENSSIYDNGYKHITGVSQSYGIGAANAGNDQVLRNWIFDNNTGCNPEAQQGGGASASKFWDSTGFLLEGNHWYDNFGNAVWLDGSSSDFTIEHEIIYNNTDLCVLNGSTVSVGDSEGVRLEVSCKTTVSSNSLSSNGTSTGGGVDVVASYGNTITNNSISVGAGGFGIRVLGQQRTAPFGGDYSTSSQCGTGADNSNGNGVTGNAITTSNTQQYNGVVGILQPVSGTKWGSNSYVAASCSADVWKWWLSSQEVRVPFSVWQSTYHLDSGSTCNE